MAKFSKQFCITAAGVALALALALALAGWQAKSGNAQEQGDGVQSGAAPAEDAPKILSTEGGEPSPPGQLDKDADGNEYISGELVVSYASDAAEKADKKAKTDRYAKVAKTFDEVDAQLVVSDEVKGIDERSGRERALAAKKKEIEAQPGVRSVSYNYVGRQMWVPNDYHWLPRSDNLGGQYQLRQVRAPGGWDYPNGRGAGVKIAVLDSGYDKTHVEFGDKVVGQRDFVGAGGPYANDDQFHGTATASIASARTNNTDGIAGAAPDARLLIAKTIDYRGSSTVADATEAVLWASNNGARVINMSFGFSQDSAALKRAVDYAFYKKNALPVCAAGNTGSYTAGGYPARYASCLTVGSSTGSSRSSFSSYGPYVDVVAPSEGVVSAMPKQVTGHPYATWTRGATSWSAPIVSGLAADVVSRKPSLSAAKVKATIERYADDIGPAGRDIYVGSGRVNFQRAIANAPRQ